MRPGELKLHIGNQSRTFFFNATSRFNLSSDLGMNPLAYVREADPEVFCAKALFHTLEGKAKKDKLFNLLTVVKWMDGEVKNEKGEEIDKTDLAIEILYARARSLTGKEGIEEIAKLDLMFSDEEDEGEDGPLAEG